MEPTTTESTGSEPGVAKQLEPGLLIDAARVGYERKLQVDYIKFRIRMLQSSKSGYLKYLRIKIEECDWHGTADCAMDLRDIESEIKGLQFCLS